MHEIWRAVPGHEGRYEVSSFGRVRSFLTVRSMLRPGKKSGGYLNVILRDPSARTRSRSVSVHRLVAIAFLGNPPERHEVNHIDGDKTNNRLENLEYVTRSENVKHAIAMGLNKRPRGADHASSKLSDHDVAKIKAIIQYRKTLDKRASDYPHEFTNVVLSKVFKVGETTLKDISRGRRWQHVKPEQVFPNRAAAFAYAQRISEK